MSVPSIERIDIWLTPTKKESLTCREISGRLGILPQTLKDRLSTYGPDHCLTYYPGSIPPRLRNLGRRAHNGGSKNSLLKKVTVRKIPTMSPHLALATVIKLIEFSQRDLEKRGCQQSRDFLLNKNGMLQWYIECIPSVDVEAFLERMRVWVATARPL